MPGPARQNARVPGQHPTPSGPDPGTAEFLQQLQQLGWFDRTTLAVLLVFFAIGLFKGLIWQVSRVAILAAAYAAAGRFGAPFAALLQRTPGLDGTAAGGDPPETTIYLAYVLLFLMVLVVLSLLAIAVQKAAHKAGLGFFDRLGGGAVGVVTGACVVLFLLFLVRMFFQGSQLAQAAEQSHAQRLSQRAVDWLGPAVPDTLREVFALSPLHGPAHPASPPGASGASGAPGQPLDPSEPAAPPTPAPGPGTGGEPGPGAWPGAGNPRGR
jgi:uncharacterized membrane protein required for colicin V production